MPVNASMYAYTCILCKYILQANTNINYEQQQRQRQQQNKNKKTRTKTKAKTSMTQELQKYQSNPGYFTIDTQANYSNEQGIMHKIV